MAPYGFALNAKAQELAARARAVTVAAPTSPQLRRSWLNVGAPATGCRIAALELPTAGWIMGFGSQAPF